jgi:hypothetical protein
LITYNAGARSEVFIYDIAKNVLDASNKISLFDSRIDTGIDLKNTTGFGVDLVKNYQLLRLSSKSLHVITLPKILWNKEQL